MKDETKQRWSSRKFWSAMVWVGVFSVMRVLDYLPADAYVSLTMVILGAYFAANVFQHLGSIRK